MNSKVCFKCGIEKELSEYYKHKQMGDGHLNKCKDCTKKDTKERHDVLIENPEWKKQEQRRHREKYHRLGYCEKHKPTPERKKEQMARYKERYPEKVESRKFLKGLYSVIDGNHLHHWSYNKEHYRDVIEVSEKEHNKAHRFLVYDQERFMYRRIDTMELLDTRERHEEYIRNVIQNEED